MANDRLYLVCPHDGEGFMLAKRFGDAWETRNYGGTPYDKRLDEFLAKHWRCRAGEVDDPHNFRLMNEIEAFRFAAELTR